MPTKNYYGLRGVKLNIAIAIVAGTDFALFGYDQVRAMRMQAQAARTDAAQGVLGGLLTLPTFLERFPQVNVDDPPEGWTKGKASNVQGE